MDASELLTLFRQQVGDVVEPQLWSDAEVYTYIDDAQKLLCRQTGGLGDATSPATLLNIGTDSDWVNLDKKILKIRSANRVDNGAPITIWNKEDADERSLRFAASNKGTVRTLVIGIEANKARTYPFPAEAVAIRLVVDRLPLKSISEDYTTFEVDEQHHIYLLDWVKHRAYLKDDPETLDPRKSDKFGAAFMAYCAQAKAEKARARHKTRVVTYGGI